MLEFKVSPNKDVPVRGSTKVEPAADNWTRVTIAAEFSNKEFVNLSQIDQRKVLEQAIQLIIGYYAVFHDLRLFAEHQLP